MYAAQGPMVPMMNARYGVYEGSEQLANAAYGAYPYNEEVIMQGEEFYEEVYDNSMVNMNYSNFSLPEVIRNFILHFHKNLVEQNLQELSSIYEQSFGRLSDRFFSDHPWPSVEIIAPYVQQDMVFLTLYQELRFRHIYGKLQPTLDDRAASFENYMNWFNYLLNNEEPVPLELPNQWLWDMIDEFVYQFQSFCQYRSKLKNKHEDEIERLKMNPQIWSTHAVLDVLHLLVDKSCINAQLVAARSGEISADIAGEYGSKSMYKMLGYFSLIGLLRIHCLFGDYHLALKLVEQIELNKRALFTKVTGCHIATYYYIGFAYMMMRRYQDAARAFTHILTFLIRNKQYHHRYDQFMKRTEQLFALLAICIAVCPQKIDDAINGHVREHFGDKIVRMQRGDESCFEELFSFACPKFISPTFPNLDALQNTSQDAARFQLRLFKMEMRQQLHNPAIRSVLKLYTTMDTDKLSSLLDMSSEEFRTQLLCFKHKTQTLRVVDHSKSLLEGEWHPTSDIDFYLRGDMIHVTENKVARQYGDFFLRYFMKFENILSYLKQKPSSSTV